MRSWLLNLLVKVLVFGALIFGGMRWYAGYRERKVSEDVQRIVEKINSVAPTSRAFHLRARNSQLMTATAGGVDADEAARMAVMEKFGLTREQLVARLLSEAEELREVLEELGEMQGAKEVDETRIFFLRRHVLRETAGAEFAAGRTEEAVNLYRQVANLYRREDDLRGWASAHHQLAAALRKNGDDLEARHLTDEVLKARMEAFGEWDPDTMQSLTAKALWWDEADARLLLENAFAICEKLKGRHHMETRARAFGLGQRDGVENAEQLFLRALEAWNVEGQAIDVLALQTVTELAALYRVTGRTAMAEALFLKAIADAEKVFGKDHLETLNVIDRIVSLYGFLDEYEKAAPLLAWLFESRMRTLGADDAKTCRAAYLLAHNEARHGNLGHALEHANVALIGWRKIEGEESDEAKMADKLIADIQEAKSP